MGSLCSLKLLAEYRCVTWVSRFVGRLMMLMASNGHFLGQIPHPMHSRSEMKAILESGVTSMHSLPVRTTGQDFLHSCRHFCASVRLFPFDIRGEMLAFGLHCHRTHATLAFSEICVEGQWAGERYFVAIDDSDTTEISVYDCACEQERTYRVSLSDMVAETVVDWMASRRQGISAIVPRLWRGIDA